VSSLWVPLPFPSCPNCHRSWVQSFHRDCDSGRELVVEPSTRRARCEGCGLEWAVLETTFHCSCGRVFPARDVETALSTAELLRLRLVEQLRSMDAAEHSIRQSGRHSLSQWLYDVAHSLGYAAGTIVGALRRWLDELWPS
jgi:hypothetical protein